jgi:hypothetical protein
MHCVCASDLTSGDYVWDFEVGFARGRFSDTNRFVGLMDVQRIGVSFRINSYCLKTKIVAGSYDPDSNLTSIGYEHFMHEAIPLFEKKSQKSSLINSWIVS